jgi:hypothetical protein
MRARVLVTVNARQTGRARRVGSRRYAIRRGTSRTLRVRLSVPKAFSAARRGARGLRLSASVRALR